MTYKQAVDYFDDAAALAKALGITKGAVYRWRDSNRVANKKIPWQWQCAIADVTRHDGKHGALFATLGPWEK